MRWLLFLYPRAWRRRYGEEYLALLEDVGPSPKVVADALLGAVSAHLSGPVTEAPAPQPVAAAAPPMPPSPTPRPFQNRRPDQFEGAIDQLIREGRERGLFDNLPGTGKPLPLGDENPFAGEWALAFKILKQSGETLPWIALGHEVDAAMARLDADLATTANRLRRLRAADPAGYPADRARARAAYLAAAAEVDTKLAQYARMIPHPHFDRGRLTPPTAAHRFDRTVD